MVKPQFSARFLLWLVLFCLLMMGVVMAWQHMQPQAEKTGFSVARKSILDRANDYKQYWLVHKQPGQLVINGKTIVFNPHGWVLPVTEGKTDCRIWLAVLYPEVKIMGLALLGIDQQQQGDALMCRYRYQNRHSIVISLDKQRFKVQ